MKSVSIDKLKDLPGRRLREGETFSFQCRPGLACFNRCCRNLNLFLYPYDVLRLKNILGMSSDVFLDQYVDVVLREGSYFPEVLLKMSDREGRPCPFVTDAGCRIYPDRPDTCRHFPMEQGLLHNERGKPELVHFFRPPEFCLGPEQPEQWTVKTWSRDQDAVTSEKMTVLWAEIRQLFTRDPWGSEGPEGRKAKMSFMAAYNLDRFRGFVFESSFLSRYRVKSDLLKKLRKDEQALLRFGFDWIKLFMFGIGTKKIRPR
jgi:uncharacterized protein